MERLRRTRKAAFFIYLVNCYICEKSIKKMSTETITYIIAPALSALLGGLAWLVKRYFNKKDEEQKAIFAQRDADKQEMKDNISNLQSDLKKTNKKINDIAGIIIGCEHPDCPSRKLLSDYMQREEA